MKATYCSSPKPCHPTGRSATHGVAGTASRLASLLVVARVRLASSSRLARIFHQGRGRCADAGASDVEREGRSPMPYQGSLWCIGEHLSATAPHMRRANPRSPDDPIWLSDARRETACSERAKIHERGRPDEISRLEAPAARGAGFQCPPSALPLQHSPFAMPAFAHHAAYPRKRSQPSGAH